MTTNWTVHLADGRSAHVECDEWSTRQSGDLWALKAVKSPPAALQMIAVWAARQWVSVQRSDVEIVVSDAVPPPPPAPARLIPPLDPVPERPR